MRARARSIGLTVAGVVIGGTLAMTVPSFAGGGLGLAGSSPSQAPPTELSTATASVARTVTVSGTATVHSTPDEAVVSLGVQTDASSAENAMHENAARMTEVLKALAGLGVKPADISTTGVSLNPTYGNSGSSVTGFQVQDQVSVTFHDLSLVGKAIDAAVHAGANLSSGIGFQMSNGNGGDGQALADAVANAKSRASAIAAASDAQLGRVLSVTEVSGPVMYPPTPYMGSTSAGDAASSTPVSPPTLETQVSVQVVWELI